MRAAAGDGQRGAAGAALPLPLAVTVTDGAGAPVPGVTVTWSADHGSLEPRASVTDARGRAGTTWTLGAGAPVQRAAAAAAGLPAATFEARLLDRAAALVTLGAIELQTYDGSGEVVHPDHAAAPAGWAPAPQFLAATPYPGGDASRENPSLYAGHDGLAWRVPAGVANPLARPTGGHLSDPDLVFDPDRGELRLYYRQAGAANVVYLMASPDGVRWGAPREVASAPNHQLVSPAVVRRGPGDWWMWAVNGGAGCQAPAAALEVRRSADGVTWSAPERARLAQPGLSPWHVDVQWLPSRGEFWALYNAKTAGSCTTRALYLARSADGVSWTTYPSPVLEAGAIPEFADVVYRASFAYDAAADVVTLWASGARLDGGRYTWRAAVERRSGRGLLAAVAQPAGAAGGVAAARSPRPARGPELTDASAP